jgi:hypothetical protein
MLKLLKTLSMLAGYGVRLLVADPFRGRHCESALADDALWRCHAAS